VEQAVSENGEDEAQNTPLSFLVDAHLSCLLNRGEPIETRMLGEVELKIPGVAGGALELPWSAH
jgi:hypothetical protein